MRLRPPATIGNSPRIGSHERIGTGIAGDVPCPGDAARDLGRNVTRTGRIPGTGTLPMGLLPAGSPSAGSCQPCTSRFTGTSIASPSVPPACQLPPGRTDMALPSTSPASKPTTTAAAPALHALVVAPAVGSLVLMLVAVGFAALAIGMFSGMTGRHRSRQRGGQGERTPVTPA